MKRLVITTALLVACSDGGGGGARTLDPSHLRIVAGDQQIGAVAGASSGAVFRVYGAGDVVNGVLSDTLIAEILGTVEGRDGIMSPSGNVELPPGTIVEYTVLSDGCGAPYITSVTPDSDSRARTLWEVPGARQNLTPLLQDLRWHEVDGDSIWASRCEMQARLKLGAEFRADTSFVAYFEPGPITRASLAGPTVTFVGDTLLLPIPSFADAHGNGFPNTRVQWTGVDGVYPASRMAWVEPTEEGRDSVTATLEGTSVSAEVISLTKIGPGWTYEMVCTNGSLAWAPSFQFDSLRYTYRLQEPYSYDPLRIAGDTAVQTWLTEYEQMAHRTGASEPNRPNPSTQVFRFHQILGAVAIPEYDHLVPLLTASDDPVTEYLGDASGICINAEEARASFRAPSDS